VQLETFGGFQLLVSEDLRLLTLDIQPAESADFDFQGFDEVYS